MQTLCRGDRGRGRKIAGITLVVLGLFWFAHKAGWIPAHGDGPALFWPLLTILLGVGLLVFGRAKAGRQEERE